MRGTDGGGKLVYDVYDARMDECKDKSTMSPGGDRLERTAFVVSRHMTRTILYFSSEKSSEDQSLSPYGTSSRLGLHSRP